MIWKTDETGRLCRTNLAVHGLEGDIRHGGNVNSYYADPHARNPQRRRVGVGNDFGVDDVCFTIPQGSSFLAGLYDRIPLGLYALFRFASKKMP